MASIVVIAGVATGVGKTSVTLGLLEALRRRGLRVQAFKVGPEGYLIGRTLMSYVHLHFASNPELPHAFVAACAGSRP